MFVGALGAQSGEEQSKASARGSGKVITNQAYRFELAPNLATLTLLAKSAGTARYAWNWGLAHRIALLKQYPDHTDKRRYCNAIELHKRWNVHKIEKPWIYDVSKCCGQEAFRNLDVALKSFYAGRKAGRRVGFPKFKRKGKSRDSFRLTGAVRVSGRYAVLPRLGSIRLKEKAPKLKGRILEATVSRVADRWFVSFSVVRERPEPVAPTGPVVGIDLGIKHFATIHDGETTRVVDAPKPLVAGLRKLRSLSKAHSRKKRGSKNKAKATLKLARHQARTANIRNDFLHKLTTDLAKTKQALVVEDLCVRGLARTRLAKHVLDAGWSGFRRMTAYKTEWFGSRLIVADRFFPSSKLCSGCGNKKVDLTLSDRTYECCACGLMIDRDENASINLQRFGLAVLANPTTASSAERKACGSERSGRYRKVATKRTEVKQEEAA